MQFHRKDNQVFIQVEAYRHEHVVMRVLTLALVASILGYGYFVSLSIHNVIAHKEAVTKAEQVKSSVGVLEQEYFQLTKAMTPEMGYQLGLAPAAEREYVRRVGPVGLASPQDEI